MERQAYHITSDIWYICSLLTLETHLLSLLVLKVKKKINSKFHVPENNLSPRHLSWLALQPNQTFPTFIIWWYYNKLSRKLKWQSQIYRRTGDWETVCNSSNSTTVAGSSPAASGETLLPMEVRLSAQEGRKIKPPSQGLHRGGKPNFIFIWSQRQHLMIK